VKLVFENVNTYAADVSIRGRRSSAAVAPGGAVSIRAADFSKTLYDLGDPAAHRISVRHEYVETRLGARAPADFLARHRLAGVTVTDMDSGGPVKLSGPAGRLLIELPVAIENDRQSAHLRITGGEQDPAYRIERDQLAWEKTLHEPRTTILLPAGWEPVTITTPATVTTTREGRVCLQVYNPRPDPTTIAIRAARAPGGRGSS
jgi:hypothetical protein